MSSLHTKLTATYLLLLLLSGGLFLWVAIESTYLQRDDVTQRLHRSLAKSLVKENPLRVIHGLHHRNINKRHRMRAAIVLKRAEVSRASGTHNITIAKQSHEGWALRRDSP